MSFKIEIKRLLSDGLFVSVLVYHSTLGAGVNYPSWVTLTVSRNQEKYNFMGASLTFEKMGFNRLSLKFVILLLPSVCLGPEIMNHFSLQ